VRCLLSRYAVQVGRENRSKRTISILRLIYL